ncbi:hypothetical protein AB0N26_33400 [Streptomyces cellulosae]
MKLRSLLLEAGWSGADLARAVNALGTRQGLRLRYDRTAVGHWLAGSCPSPPVPDFVAQCLSRRLGREIIAADAGLAAASGPSAAPPSLAGLARGDQLLRHASYLPSPLTVGSIAHGEAHARGDLLVAEHFVRLYGALGGGHVRTALVTYIADKAPTSAPLGFLLATMTADTRSQGLAYEYYRATLTVADPDIAALSLRAMSVQAQRLGHPLAAAYAEAALQLPTSPAVRAFLYTGRAATREPRAALRDLACAENLMEEPGSRAGALQQYPRAGFDYQKGVVLRRAGDPRGALRAFESSLRHRPPENLRAVLLTRAHLAELLLASGHLDAACEHWQHFLSAPSVESFLVRRARSRMQALLAPYGRSRQAADLLVRSRTGKGGS